MVALGVKTPQVYDFVTDGKRFGYTAQKIAGKKSFSRLVADNPGETDRYARLYAQEALAFHATPCDTSAFPSMHKEMADIIAESRLLSDDAKQEALAILADIPDPHTCLHGVFTTGNLITDGKDSYWIDMGWFSYGNPLFDLTQFYFYQKYLPTLFLRKVIHLNHRQIKAFSISLSASIFSSFTNRRNGKTLNLLSARSCISACSRWPLRKPIPWRRWFSSPLLRRTGAISPRPA